MKPNKTILITYNYFLPAYKAGGPIQSIANMIRYMNGYGLDFKVICSANEYGTNTALDVQKNTWVDFENGSAQVYYVSKEMEKKSIITAILKETQIDLIFVNGVFNLFYNIFPIILTDVPIITSARGMLHPGGLSQKSLKKIIFIKILKFCRITKKVYFHAIDEKEATYIKGSFGSNAKVFVCPNFPRLFTRLHSEKAVGTLKLCSIALISPMKNHLQIIKALAKIKSHIKYDIYGPIKDIAYWKKCLNAINELPGNIHITYHGDLNPSLVEIALKNCHVFILPSKSENYGHALVEALSAGKPVITSFNTPWQNLGVEKAGWNIDPDNIGEVAKAIEVAASLSNLEYESYSQSAAVYVNKRIDIECIKNQYLSMFKSAWTN